MTEMRTPLHGAHDDAGASFTDFNGWEMPVEFDSIRTEHASVREAVGKFDVSHMGQIEVGGPDAAALCQGLTTNDVEALEPGEAQYSMITDDTGTILDDTVVYRLPEAADSGTATAGSPDGDDASYLFVPNAGNDEAMFDRWETYRDQWDLDASVANATTEYAMVAVQGPDAEETVTALVEGTGAHADEVADLSAFDCARATVAGAPSLVARTGYTGEDGYEVLCASADAEAVWSALDCQPCGLGARDTLRMEMGFLLSGQDFHTEENPRNPYEAGVGFAVDLDTEFVGQDALEVVADARPEEVFVGLRLTERGVPRHGYDIVSVDEDDGEDANVGEDGDEDEGEDASAVVGTVTSGTMSPTLGEPIGLGYLPVELAEEGTAVAVVIRGEPKTATTVTPPFIGGN